MSDRMSFERFEELAMIHGPALAEWPEAERAAAEALLARDPAARAALGRAADLFAALEAEAEASEEVPAPLMARILADAAAAAPAPAPAVKREPARRRAGGSWLMRLLPPVALAASALIGIALGYSAPDSVEISALGADDAEFWAETAMLTDDQGEGGTLQ